MWGLIIACFVYGVTAFFIFLSFFIDYKKGKKLSRVQITAILLFAVVLYYGVWDQVNKYRSADRDKHDIIDTVSKKSDSINNNTDAVGADIKRKIDSAKRTTIDSMRSINQGTTIALQNIIDRQAIKIDSLLRLHVEKHLTDADEKDIVMQLDELGKQNNTQIHILNLFVSMSSNGQVFLQELGQFLANKGYEGGRMANIDTRLMGYKIEYEAPGVAKITVGTFDLSK